MEFGLNSEILKHSFGRKVVLKSKYLSIYQNGNFETRFIRDPLPRSPRFLEHEKTQNIAFKKPVGGLDSCYDRTMNKKPEKIELCKTERTDKNSDLITNFSF